MKEFLLALYIEHGDRAFPYKQEYNDVPAFTFGQCLDNNYIALIRREKYDAQDLPYKLTAKALEYIKAHD